jgi:hypothetical protein
MKNDFFKYNLENNELFYYPFLRLNDTFTETKLTETKSKRNEINRNETE